MQAQREYYNHELSHSRYSSQTSRKLRSQLPRDDFTDAKTVYPTSLSDFSAESRRLAPL
jgi:hypothetical protein